MIKDIFFTLPEDGFEWFMFVFAWFIAIIIASLLLWGIYFAIDNWFTEEIVGTGVVLRKDHTDAHYQTIMIYNSATKTSLPHMQYIPESWQFLISVDGEADWVSVSEDQYESLNISDKVKAVYNMGRISDWINIRQIY